jgi:hypothetical protein
MNTQETNSNYFVLKGLASILIGGFIFGGNYVIQSILDNATIDNSMIINLISIPILVFLLSSFTLYFSGKKAAKKTQNKLWNAKTKIVFKKYSFGFV